MQRLLVVSAAAGLLFAGGQVRAQEPSAPEAVDERPAIRVLAHPYDIASFYRSPDSAGAPGDVRADPYAISGFYRAQGSSYRPFAPYWSPYARSWGSASRTALRGTQPRRQHAPAPDHRPAPGEEAVPRQ